MRLPLIVCFVLLISCGEREEVVLSATACAKSFKDGSVVECEPSKAAIDDLDNLMAETRRIDAAHPGPKMPGLEKLFSVTEVTREGGLILDEGNQLMLAGVECNTHPELTKYLKALFIIGGTSKVVYELTGSVKGSNKLAYVWMVDTEFGAGIDEDGISFGSMVSNINETALSSGWCIPQQQEGHEYHERYVQLSKLAS